MRIGCCLLLFFLFVGIFGGIGVGLNKRRIFLLNFFFYENYNLKGNYMKIVIK